MKTFKAIIQTETINEKFQTEYIISANSLAEATDIAVQFYTYEGFDESAKIKEVLEEKNICH